MKTRFGSLLVLSSLLLLASPSSQAETLDAEPVREIVEKVADWHMANPIEWLGLRWWHQAPFYDGLIAAAEATGEARFLAKVIDYGERSGWAPSDRIYHADDHAVGHAWLDIYMMNTKQDYRLQPMKERLDFVVENPVLEDLRFGGTWNERVTDRWTWCDALYMAPPTLVRLYQITGDEKYLRFMDHEYRATYDELWDAEEKLFYRDSRFIDERTENGKKIFWSRGNGWVYGGLTQVLSRLPEDDLSYPFYRTLFLEMTEGVVAAQQADGLWRPSLRDPQHVATGEASGTAFFIFGLAWGINHGLLEAETYLPVVESGWNGLVGLIHENGMVGHVQPVGADPQDNISAEDTQAYGAGATLLAGSEILRLLGKESDKSEEVLYAEANALIRSGQYDRVTNAYVVPRRVDDVAWENDKVAFRAYGPALKESTEDSGIDVWTKRVDYPIVKSWYETEFAGEGSYHLDTGEGYDAFKVGAARGCGGTGVWYDGKFYTAKVYQRASVLDTKPGRLEITLDFKYDIEGRSLYESKRITLRSGSYLCEAKSVFRGDKELLKGIRVSVGLTPQNETVTFSKEKEAITLWDKLGDTWLTTGVRLVDGFKKGSVKAEQNGTDLGDALVTAKLEENSLSYVFGFAWERHSAFSDANDWMEYLQSFDMAESESIEAK